jgi:hypothetical protein
MTSSSIYDALGYTIGQCTDGAAKIATWVGAQWGDASQWLGNAAQQGFPESSTPQIGDVAVWGANMGGALGAGHVAVVTGLQANGDPIVEEENWTNGPGNFDSRLVSPSSAAGIIGYIEPKPGETTVLPNSLTNAQNQSPTATMTATGWTGFNPLGFIEGLPAQIGGAVGTAVGTAAGETAAGTATGMVSGISAAAQGFYENTVKTWFGPNAIPLVAGVAILYVLFGADGAKKTVDTGTTIVTNTVRGAGTAGKGIRQGVAASRAAPLAEDAAVVAA